MRTLPNGQSSWEADHGTQTSSSRRRRRSTNRTAALWIIGSGLVIAVAAGTWWLLINGTRGAEVANVLALPAALVGTVVAVIGISIELRGRRPTDTASIPSIGRHRASAEHTEPVERPNRAMTTELFFLAGHPAPLHDTAAELRRAGYLVREQPRDLGDCWSLTAHSASSTLGPDHRAELERMAHRCGALFDGTGTYVGPPELDDGPGLH